SLVGPVHVFSCMKFGRSANPPNLGALQAASVENHQVGIELGTQEANSATSPGCSQVVQVRLVNPFEVSSPSDVSKKHSCIGGGTRQEGRRRGLARLRRSTLINTAVPVPPTLVLRYLRSHMLKHVLEEASEPQGSSRLARIRRPQGERAKTRQEFVILGEEAMLASTEYHELL